MLRRPAAIAPLIVLVCLLASSCATYSAAERQVAGLPHGPDRFAEEQVLYARDLAEAYGAFATCDAIRRRIGSPIATMARDGSISGSTQSWAVAELRRLAPHGPDGWETLALHLVSGSVRDTRVYRDAFFCDAEGRLLLAHRAAPGRAAR